MKVKRQVFFIISFLFFLSANGAFLLRDTDFINQELKSSAGFSDKFIFPCFFQGKISQEKDGLAVSFFKNDYKYSVLLKNIFFQHPVLEEQYSLLSFFEQSQENTHIFAKIEKIAEIYKVKNINDKLYFRYYRAKLFINENKCVEMNVYLNN